MLEAGVVEVTVEKEEAVVADSLEMEDLTDTALESGIWNFLVRAAGDLVSESPAINKSLK